MTDGDLNKDESELVTKRGRCPLAARRMGLCRRDYGNQFGINEWLYEVLFLRFFKRVFK